MNQTQADSSVGKLDCADLVGKTLRVYNTGDVISQDLKPDRSNIELNPSTKRIVKVWIG